MNSKYQMKTSCVQNKLWYLWIVFVRIKWFISVQCCLEPQWDILSGRNILCTSLSYTIVLCHLCQIFLWWVIKYGTSGCLFPLIYFMCPLWLGWGSGVWVTGLSLWPLQLCIYNLSGSQLLSKPSIMVQFGDHHIGIDGNYGVIGLFSPW